MVEFSADLTDPPALDTSDPGGTLMNYLGYMIVAGVALAAFSAGTATVQPLVADILGIIPGINSGEDDEISVV